MQALFFLEVGQPARSLNNWGGWTAQLISFFPPSLAASMRVHTITTKQRGFCRGNSRGKMLNAQHNKHPHDRMNGALEVARPRPEIVATTFGPSLLFFVASRREDKSVHLP